MKMAHYYGTLLTMISQAKTKEGAAALHRSLQIFVAFFGCSGADGSMSFADGSVHRP